MDITARLTAEEVAAISDAERSCEDALQTLAAARQTDTTRAGVADTEAFLDSLKLKNTLDFYEELARTEPSWQHLSVLLNCEYQLYRTNQAIPLRHNPFLSHWVEAIQRLAQNDPRARASEKIDAQPASTIRSDEIAIARADFIRALLQAQDVSRFARQSPRSLFRKFSGHNESGTTDVAAYVGMLEEEGIYEPSRTSGTTAFGPTPAARESMSKSGEAEAPRTTSLREWKQSIMEQLKDEPDTAVRRLTHLPIELSSLDFLTTLLQDQILQHHSVEPSHVIREYLQHALRLAEQMGQPAANDSDTEGIRSNAGISDHAIDLDHGRGAQTRAVKLLLLFLRNLIRKALLPPEAVYFEIQEICVRYVWIKEVRDFRSFIEEGTVNEQHVI